MKDNWNELFDSMKEEDILRNLPEDLPEMEDELAAKRIENRVMQEMQIEMGLQKKQHRKRILAAAVCCIVAVGAVGHKPIMAAFQRLFHDLPGVGVYINDEDVKVYEVQIDDPVQEQDGIRVELRNFYCEGNILYGMFEFTGEGLPEMDVHEDEVYIEKRQELKERFRMTYYYGDKSRILYAPNVGLRTEDGKLIRYTRECEEFVPVKEGIFEYQIEINGFDRRFNLKLVDPKTVETPEEIGYSQTKNDTTVTARAAIVDDMIEMEYFIIPSDEVKLAQENKYRHFILNVPYQYDMEDQYYFENAAGERMQYEKFREMANGRKFWFDGSEEDFPVKFHLPTLTGTSLEKYEVTIPLPEDGGKITENLPKLEFEYGTVEVLSVTKEQTEYDIGHMEEEEYVPAAEVDFMYRVTPKEGIRQMYSVEIDVAEEIYASGGLDTESSYEGDSYVRGRTIYFKDIDAKKMTITFHMPSFWILGDYDIVIEKPVYREDAASAIDQESWAVPEY